MSDAKAEIASNADPFARFHTQTYTVLPDALIAALVEKGIGRNGWAVLAALCHRIYTDGRLGRASAQSISETTGLTKYQIARGMTELRNERIIVPVIRKTQEGYRHPDRSNFHHVAQYRICKDIWEAVKFREEDE